MKAIILAAGLSRRMGSQKLLLPFGSGTVLSTVVYNVVRAGFDETLLVVSQETAGITAELSCGSLKEILNAHPERGQGSSLALAASLGEGDFCVMLGDLPLVQGEDIILYREFFLRREPRYTALVPRFEGRFGHPSFFSGIWRQRFKELAGDSGGRSLLNLYEREVEFRAGEKSFFRDIDTPADYGQLRGERL